MTKLEERRLRVPDPNDDLGHRGYRDQPTRHSRHSKKSNVMGEMIVAYI